MIIYGNSLSPFVRKVLVFAADSGIAFESKPVGLGSRDPDFLAASPFRKIPALQQGDFTLSDSSAIVHYLDALHPAGLIPADPELRGRTVWFDEFADTILFSVAVKLFFNRVVSPKFLKRPGDLALADKAEAEELPPVLAWLESVIPPSNFLVDDRQTLADIAVASLFVNLRHAGHVPDAGTHPRLAAYVSAQLARPTFAGLVDTETRMVAAA